MTNISQASLEVALNTLEGGRAKGDFEDKRRIQKKHTQDCPACYNNDLLKPTCHLCSGRGIIKKREYTITEKGKSIKALADVTRSK